MRRGRSRQLSMLSDGDSQAGPGLLLHGLTGEHGYAALRPQIKNEVHLSWDEHGLLQKNEGND